MSRSYKIRNFRPSDGLSLEMVHRRAILNLSGGDYSQTECQSWAHGIRGRVYARIAATTETFLVAEMAHGPIAGFCSYALSDEQSGRICELYMDPAFQGLGAATAMLSLAERALVVDGAKTLVIQSSLAALTFYKRRGYEELDRVTFRTRGGLELEVANVSKAPDDAL